MAYFPNGASGDYYMEIYCMRCQNWRDRGDGRGFGCPIWDAHTLNNYDQCKNPATEEILEILWPSKENGYPGKCSMFFHNGESVGQLTMEFNKSPKPR